MTDGVFDRRPLDPAEPHARAPLARELRAQPRARELLARYLSAAAFGAFVTYYGLLCFRHFGWGGDFQMYVAGVSRLYADYFHPVHEAMDAPGSQSTMYTLYLVLVAGLGKVLGVTPYRALEVAGLLNCFIYAGSVLYFFSRHSLHRLWWLAAACFLYATLFLRWFHFGWSSETSLTNFQFMQPFPSTLGWALSFLSFGLMEDLRRRRRAAKLVALGVTLGAALITHVLTASWAVGIVGLHALWSFARERRPGTLLRPLAAIAIGVALAAAWPYAPFFGQGGMSKVNERSPFGRSPLRDFPNLYALALPCYAYLVYRLRRHAFWLLALAVTLAVLGVWRYVEFSFGNRYAFYAAFCAQFAVAEVLVLGLFALTGPLVELDPARPRPGLDRPLALFVLGAALVCWLPSPMRARAGEEGQYGYLFTPLELVRQPSPHDAYYGQFADVRAHLSSDDLVLTPVSRSVFDLAAITGVQVICSPNAFQVPDYPARRAEVARFFDRRTTPAVRAEIIARRRPTKLLVPSGYFGLLGTLTRQFGEPVYRGAEHALWDLRS